LAQKTTLQELSLQHNGGKRSHAREKKTKRPKNSINLIKNSRNQRGVRVWGEENKKTAIPQIGIHSLESLKEKKG